MNSKASEFQTVGPTQKMHEWAKAICFLFIFKDSKVSLASSLARVKAQTETSDGPKTVIMYANVCMYSVGSNRNATRMSNYNGCQKAFKKSSKFTNFQRSYKSRITISIHARCVTFC